MAANQEEMENAAEAILDLLATLDDEEAFTAAYSVIAYLIFARCPPHQWGSKVAYVQARLPIVFKGLIDEFNRRNGHTTQRISQ